MGAASTLSSAMLSHGTLGSVTLKGPPVCMDALQHYALTSLSYVHAASQHT